jgi:ubiquilin
MEQMLSSPFMQSLLSNPDIMNSMMENNPQMQQLMEQNPELRNMMNDPEFIQQSMEAMRNPAMMREMMRNTDRAMSNIESMPGGSAALHKLYNEIQAPLYEAASDIGDGNTMKGSKVTDAKQLKAKYGEMIAPKKPVSEPMRNPWATQSMTIPPVISSPVIGVPTTPSPGQPTPAPNNMFDMSAMAQMMQDPGMQQMMSSLFGQTGNSATRGPADPMSDPNFLRQMFDPNSIQAMSQLQRSLGIMSGTSGNNLGTSFGSFIAAQNNNPEERYRVQLATLRSMGFQDTQASIRALDRTGGNVDRAVDLLIAERGMSRPS